MSYTRVRKPPGGDSSFSIFGFSNEPKETKKTDSNIKAEDNKTIVENQEPQVKTDDVAAKEDEPTQKVEVTNEEDAEKEVEAEESKSADLTAAEVKPSSDVPKEISKNDENQNVLQNAKNKQRATGYNPITGETYDATALPKTEPPKAVGPTRVRQPPGGASSKLW